MLDLIAEKKNKVLVNFHFMTQNKKNYWKYKKTITELFNSNRLQA